MKKIPILTTLLLGLLALAACQKTDDAAPNGMVEIFAESMNNGGKVVLDGLSATWSSGDAIRINGTTATVERREGHAYISSDSLKSTNRALYPASLEVASWGTDNPVVTLPAYYHYRTDSSGRQVLELPMAAYSNSRTSPLQFKHLTGALYVTVKNTGATARTLQSVTVRSNTYALSGTLRVALNTDSLVAASTTGTADERAVTLVFDKVVTLANGESVRVMIPVRPVGSDNNFTIEVKSYASGQSTSYLSSKTQPSGSDHSLARNQLGYAPMDIPVSETTVPMVTFNNSTFKYEIFSALDFKLMTDVIRNKTYITNRTPIFSIMGDIDMAGMEVTPIDNIDFTGTIDGNNHTISNLVIKGVEVSGSVYCGLFLKTSFGMTFQNITFDNLSLVNENVGSSTLYVGALEAYNPNSSETTTKTFSNCTINIRQFVHGDATETVYFGGLIGCLSGAVKVNISRCHVTTPAINLSCTTTRLGGMIGQNAGSELTTIDGSSWTGAGTTSITSTYVYAGGLIGQKTSRFNVANCTVTGRMEVVSNSSYHYIGSYIGYLNTAAYNFENGNNTTGFSASLNGDEINPVKNIGNR